MAHLAFPNPFLFVQRLRALSERFLLRLDEPSESGAVEFLLSEEDWEELYPGPCIRVNAHYLVGVKLVFQTVERLGSEKIVERPVWWLASETLDGDFDEVVPEQPVLDGNSAIAWLVKTMLAAKIRMVTMNWDAEDSVRHPWRELP